MRFRIIEIPVCLRHPIGTVVVDHVSLLVQEVIAVLAEPEEAVDVTGHTCALDHELERIRCKPRRMRNQRRLEQTGSFRHLNYVLDSFFGPIVKVEIAFQ